MSGGLLPTMPRQAAMTVNDLLDNCAEVKPGQQVVIAAAFDGLAGGANLVEAFALHSPFPYQAGAPSMSRRSLSLTASSIISGATCTFGTLCKAWAYK